MQQIRVNYKKIKFVIKQSPFDLNLKTQLEEICKHIAYEVKNTKELYYLQKFNENRGNSKKSWSLVNEILSVKKSSTTAKEIDTILIAS